MISLFKQVLEMMNNQDQEALQKSMDNVHHEGLFSLVIGGKENGRLTRVFIATQKIKPFACQLHSHCYDLKIGVIKGEFLHHEAVRTSVDHNVGLCSLPTYLYHSPLNGGNGLEFEGHEKYILCDRYIPPAGEAFLHHHDIHTVSVSKGTMWIVQEQGFQSNVSTVVGKRFVLDNLYKQPQQYQINDMWQKVYEEVKQIVKGFEA